MCEVVDKFVARGVEQGIQQGFRDAARAFIEASVSRGAATDYILEMVCLFFLIWRATYEKNVST